MKIIMHETAAGRLAFLLLILLSGFFAPSTRGRRNLEKGRRADA